MTPTDTLLVFCDFEFLHGEEVNDDDELDSEKLDRDESKERLLSSRLGELSRLAAFMLRRILMKKKWDKRMTMETRQ